MGSRASRRDFLKGLLASGAGTGLSGALAQAAPEPLVAGTTTASLPALETDVLVVGAGASGVPAAIAAARGGARVVLIEEDSVPGGAPVDMYVAGPCGNPQVGIYKEMLDRMEKHHNISVHPQKKATWFLPSSYVRVIMEMLRKLPNIELLCNVRMTRVVVGEGARNRVEGVVIQRAGGAEQMIKAKVVIDATGGGEVAARAGCPSMFGRESRAQFNEPGAPETPDSKIQECTWMFITHKIRPDAVMDLTHLRWMPNESGYGWINKKDPAEVAAFQKRDAGIYLHWGGHITCADTRDPALVAKAQLDAMVDVIERDGPRLEKLGFAMTLAPRLGVRESRRIVGEQILTVADLARETWPDDVVATGNYGIDAWGDKNAEKIRIPKRGYGIPYRALLARGMQNLMVVGKAISATHLAQSAVRVQPIVSQMGQAAGTAAALAVAKKTELRSIEIKELQKKLREAGLLG